MDEKKTGQASGLFSQKKCKEIKILKERLMNTTYFICILKKLNLSLRSFEK